jgi:hypothetical protein
MNNECFTEFIEIAFVPCIVDDGIAIDITTKQIYQILPLNKGRIPASRLLDMDPISIYADQVLTPQFNCSSEELAVMQKRADQTANWYTKSAMQRNNYKVNCYQKIRKRGAIRHI